MRLIIAILLFVLIFSKNVFAALKLNEIYPAPPSGEYEWVELYNDGNQIIDISQYQLLDLAGNKIKISTQSALPFGFVLATSSSVLNNTGDTISLKNNLKEGIGMEKKENERQRARGEVLQKISEKITFELPEKMVEYEQIRLLEDLKNQIASQFKIPFEEYLKSVKKTEEELKANYKLEAEKRIKNFLVLREVGKQEKIEVSREELEQEINKELRKYTKEQIEKIDLVRLKEYTKGAIFNEKVFQLLESFS